jgi:hypothetical protein
VGVAVGMRGERKGSAGGSALSGIDSKSRSAPIGSAMSQRLSCMEFS